MALYPQWFQRWMTFAVFAAAASGVRAAEFRDRYLERETVTADRGRLEGDNTGASVEADEPRHGGKRPSHSLWVSWVAPTNGLVTLRLEGRGLDPLLGVYQVRDVGGSDPEIRRLERVEGNDDDRDVTTSFAQFGVRAGERYEIAVDGFAGETGPLVLTWDLQAVDQLIPSVILVNGDRAATVGESVTLSVAVGQGEVPKLHWYFNDTELETEEGSMLVIPNFQAANVGHYRVRVEVGKADFFSDSVELQISSEGIVTALARNKPEDAIDSPLQGGDPAPATVRARLAPAGIQLTGGSSGLTRGYNGTQIFNTLYAGRDLTEPAHCGVGGGASYWFAYSPPESGALELDTDGSAFDTVLAVYTYDPPLLGYVSLQPVDCDNNSGSNGLTSRLRVNCEFGRPYLVVVDGVNGARGLTYLNYRLVTNSVPAVPPLIGPTPSPVSARVGDRVALTVAATGTPPLSYQWRRGTADLLDATNATLVLESVQLEHASGYSVRVSNGAGAATMPEVSVSVWGQPALVLTGDGSQARLQFTAAGPLHYSVENSSDLAGTNWLSTAGDHSGTDPVDIAVPLDSTTRFLRVRFD